MATVYRQIQRASAILAIFGCFVQIVFQFCLAVGVPWGRAAWGGQTTTLPSHLRIASGIAVFVWIFVLSVVLQKISKVFDGAAMARDVMGTLRIRRCQSYSPDFVSCTMWVLTILMFLVTVENFASRSPVERYTWGPFCVVLAISFLVLTKSKSNEASSTSSGEETNLLSTTTAEGTS
jgi:hypothetical protein